MKFLDAITNCYINAFSFGGRATRPEYWWFFLFYLTLSVVFAFFIPGSETVVAVVLFIPSLSVAWRRFHDIGRPGYTGLLPLIALGAAMTAAMIAQDQSLSSRIHAGLALDGVLVQDVSDAIGLAATSLYLLFALQVAWCFVLLAWPSQEASNRYGPGPGLSHADYYVSRLT